MPKTTLGERKGYLGRFMEFCEECGHAQQIGVWIGREYWICSVCKNRTTLKPYIYYVEELKG